MQTKQEVYQEITRKFIDRLKLEYGFDKPGKQIKGFCFITAVQFLSRKTGGGKLKNLRHGQAIVLAMRALSRDNFSLHDALEICPDANPQRRISAQHTLLTAAKAVQKKNAPPFTQERLVAELQNQYVMKKHVARFRDKDFYKSREWRELRLIVLDAQRVCRLCGRGPDMGVVLHIDHIKPRSIYPELSLDPCNLQVLCAECNKTKSNLLQNAY